MRTRSGRRAGKRGATATPSPFLSAGRDRLFAPERYTSRANLFSSDETRPRYLTALQRTAGGDLRVLAEYFRAPKSYLLSPQRAPWHTSDAVSRARVPRLRSTRSSNQVSSPVRISWAGARARTEGTLSTSLGQNPKGSREVRRFHASTPSPGRTPTCEKSPSLQPPAEPGLVPALTPLLPRTRRCSQLSFPGSSLRPRSPLHPLFPSFTSSSLFPPTPVPPGVWMPHDLSFFPSLWASSLFPDVLSPFARLHSSFHRISAPTLPSFQGAPGFSVRRRGMPRSAPRAQSSNLLTAHRQGPWDPALLSPFFLP